MAYIVSIDQQSNGAHDSVFCANANEVNQYLFNWCKKQDDENCGETAFMDFLKSGKVPRICESYHCTLFPFGTLIHIQELSNFSLSQLALHSQGIPVAPFRTEHHDIGQMI